jgi:hypothetical protein
MDIREEKQLKRGIEEHSSEQKLWLSPPLLLCSSTFLAVLPQILQFFSPISCNPPLLVSKYLPILSVANTGASPGRRSAILGT